MSKRTQSVLLGFAILFGLFAGFNNKVSAIDSSPSCNSATIYGKVTTNGTPTRAWFEWGDQTYLGTATSGDTFNTDGTLSRTLDGLSEDTIYFFRIVVSNQYGTVNGNTLTFRTSKCASPTPPNPSPSNPTPTYNPPAPTPSQPAPSCSESANVSISGPSTLSPGQSGTFNVHVNNTGTSWWYHGSYFQLVQQSNFTISPTYGHYTPGMYSGDSRDFTFSLTAPNTPGTYTFSMQNVHRTGADYQLANGTVCKSAPGYDVYFGNTGSASFTVSGGGSTNPNPAAPTVALSANPTSVAYSGSSVLTWSSTNATSCTATSGANNWAGTKSTSGTFSTGALTSSTTYGITCTNSVGSASDSATVTVGAQTQNPTVTYAASAPITINNTNTNTNTNNNGGGYSYQPPVYQTPTYVPPYTYPTNPTVTITADRQSISSGENTIIRWYTNNATSCYGTSGSNGWTGTRSAYADSFFTGILYYTTTYGITCTNSSGGSASSSVTVNVGAQTIIGNRPTVVLSADQTSLQYNGATTLRWYTSNAASCFASDGSFGWAGAKSIGPASFYTGSLTASRNYTLTCSNSFGSASDSVSVNVRGLVISNPAVTTPTSLVLINSSVDRTQPIVPTIDNTRPHPGDEINYTVNYQNIGTGPITNLNLQMVMPAEVDYLFSTPANPNLSGHVLVFNLGTLKANGSGTVTVRVRVREDIPAGVSLNFPATLSYIDPSSNPQSVSANVSAQVWSEDTNQNVTNPNEPIQLGANVFGAGFLPNNLFGWLLLIVLVLLLLLLLRYLFNQMTQEKIVYVNTPPTPPSH